MFQYFGGSMKEFKSYLKLTSFYVIAFAISFMLERNTEASEESINNIISSLEKSEFVMDLAESAIMLVMLQVVVILYTCSYLLIQKLQKDNCNIDTEKEYKLKNVDTHIQ